MPRKTVNPDEVAMRGHGCHVWTAPSGQTFWCFCDNGKDHKTEPAFAYSRDPYGADRWEP